MSGFGLLPFGPLRARSAARVALSNARRGFAKFSQHGDRFALCLDLIRAGEPIEARTLAPDAPVSDAVEGIALAVQSNDFARLCDREGYSGGAAQQLRQEAVGRAQELGQFLWSLLHEVGFATPVFRQRLYRVVGYTSAHYIPHPVRLDGSRFGVTFLAPGAEGTGSERVIAVRVRTGNLTLLTANEAWQRKPNRTQLAYFAAALLGGMHGISVHDILQPLASDRSLSDRLRVLLAAEQRLELTRFLEMTGLDHGAYWHAFGPPTQSARRSGLEQFLKGCN